MTGERKKGITSADVVCCNYGSAESEARLKRTMILQQRPTSPAGRFGGCLRLLVIWRRKRSWLIFNLSLHLFIFCVHGPFVPSIPGLKGALSGTAIGSQSCSVMSEHAVSERLLRHTITCSRNKILHSVPAETRGFWFNKCRFVCKAEYDFLITSIATV